MQSQPPCKKQIGKGSHCLNVLMFCHVILTTDFLITLLMPYCHLYYNIYQQFSGSRFAKRIFVPLLEGHIHQFPYLVVTRSQFTQRVTARDVRGKWMTSTLSARNLFEVEMFNFLKLVSNTDENIMCTIKSV